MFNLLKLSMKIFVKVKPNARQDRIIKDDENHFIVFVKEPASQGKANNGTRKIIADYFDVALTRVSILSGGKTRRKTIEII